MRIALISDIHSNCEALTSVIEEIEASKVDEIYCLGDLVGYGPEPNECVAKVVEVSSVIIAGNHDFAAVGLTDTDYFNVYARDAIEWTTEILRPENHDILSALELTFEHENALFVHATPEHPDQWDYIISNIDAELNFHVFSEQVCFIGHSHTPITFSTNSRGNIDSSDDSFIKFESGKQYIVNIGSVGQPRDHDPRASFGIFDTEKRTFELKRVSYDFEITQSKIFEAGLPRFLADRLAFGR